MVEVQTETTPTVRRFTVDDYYRMGEAGIIKVEDCVELLDGEIIQMSPIGPLHAAIVARLHDLLSQNVRGLHFVRSQSPIHLSDHSEPQPDIAVLRHRDDYYASAHPGPADILLLIEVSDATLAYDRNVKLPHYAEAGIPEVWIVDVGAQVIEQYAQLIQGVYTQLHKVLFGHTLTATSLPEISLTTDQVF
ncbi:MAG: Uma2 family endonuclease [Chloroflexales bacterium]